MSFAHTPQKKKRPDLLGAKKKDLKINNKRESKKDNKRKEMNMFEVGGYL